jgi:D-glycerate 3-kinase
MAAPIEPATIASLHPGERQLLRQLRLPADYIHTLHQVVKPLCQQLAEACQRQPAPLVLGLNGAQGSGKSTLAAFVQEGLRAGYALSSVVISLDDLYLTRQQRQRLAREVHPLLQTRGVPGTHDIDLGVNTVQQLLQASPQQTTAIPRFNKALDERCPEAEWDHHLGRPDLIILEGWCVGACPQADAALQTPVNALERNEDPDGLWRRYVNACLTAEYPALFSLIDRLVSLTIADFDQVYQWRAVQEHKLKAAQSQGMAEAELRRFIQHFERLTRHMMHDIPARADWVFDITRSSADRTTTDSHHRKDTP